MICLGIESTAHTLGIGICKNRRILANEKSVYKPPEGSGIHPTMAAKHLDKTKEEVLAKALEQAGLAIHDIDVLAFSQGPGLPPCLKVGLEFSKKLRSETNKPLVGVNHCVAHIEIGKLTTRAKNPVVLYVSGGNTQVIGFSAGRYRVFGETIDISIGNAIDQFIRKTLGEHPGGPVMDRLAKKGRYVELPYVVKGMSLSFSGILTSALQKYKKGVSLKDLCFSFEETSFAMLTEVTERALAHLGRGEVLLTGGVAQAPRLQEMLGIMCRQRGAKFFVVPKEYASDNGAMIAWNGMVAYKHGQKSLQKPDFIQKWRADEVDVCWI
jgi:N6-L-threonylcarbamoyladenine synthase/protein kinase Bud32